MKFNFRKIASVLAGTVMLSSTMAFAAATLPAPFVNSAGQGDFLVVYGTNPLAASTDMVAATEIQTYLSSKVTATPAPVPTNQTITGANIPLYKDNNKIELGSAMNAVYSTLNYQKLPTILKDGVFTGSDGTDYDYTQKVTLGPTTVTHFVADDSDISPNDKPVFGFDIGSGATVLNYTLDFQDSPLNSTLETQNIEMLGRTYYISNFDSSTGDLTLLDKANTAVVYEGEKTTVTVGNKTYDVEIVSNTDAKATLSVNGVKLDSINLGSSKKIATDTYLSVTDLYQGTRERDKSYVEFSIGTGQIVLSATGEKVQTNEDTVNDLTSTITYSANKITKVELSWTLDEEQYLVPGHDMTMPGLNAVKLSMLGFVMPQEETFRIANNGNDYIQFTNLPLDDGVVSAFPILFTSNQTDFTGLGKDATHVLLTNNTGNVLHLDEKFHPKFVATYASGTNYESHAFELTSISELDSGAKNETKIKNLGTGDTLTFTNADDIDVGDLNLALTGVIGDGNATLTVTHSGSSTGVFLDRVITKKGLAVRLPFISAGVAEGAFNQSAAAATWKMNFTEADKDNNVADNAGMTRSGGKSFWITLANDATNGPEVSTTTSVSITAPESGSDDKIGYVVGPHATKLYYNYGDQTTLDVTYHGDEAYADVYLAESTATIGSSSSGGSSGALLIEDTRVTTSTNANLVVVGGSCVNKVAAELLGLTYGPETSCGDAWTGKTNVAAGQYLIQTFARGGKVATLVAGYNAPDTTNAAKAFTTNTNIDATAGKKYTGSTGTTITPVVV